MPRDLEPSLAEQTFLLDALQKGLRLDRRAADAFRPLKISFGEGYGLVHVELGGTQVSCRVTAEVVQPFPEKPFEGQFLCNTEISPMCAPSIEQFSADEVVMARLIEKAIRRSRALDTESLCILAGKRCWAVRADVLFLNHEGGLVDAASLAVIAALLHFRRPEVTVTGDEDVIVHDVRTRVPVPLSILHIPICVTFSFFADGTISLVDVSLEEERLREGSMTITLNKNREVCQVSKAGGVSMARETLMRCTQIALAKTIEVTSILEAAIKVDIQSKDTAHHGGTAENDRVQAKPIG